MEDGFFLRKKPLSSMDSVNTRIENAVAGFHLRPQHIGCCQKPKAKPQLLYPETKDL
jgi:hypothetical protein